MPKSALPKHLQESDWSDTDNASWLMRQKKKLQYLLAAGPRVPSGFFKWREIPITLFAVGKPGFRIENTDGTETTAIDEPWGFLGCTWLRLAKSKRWYISRIQPWSRFHINLQWPLFLNFHIIYRQKNVVTFPTYKSSFGITKMFTFGIGFKRDGDKVYWLTCNGFGNFE